MTFGTSGGEGGGEGGKLQDARSLDAPPPAAPPSWLVVFVASSRSKSSIILLKERTISSTRLVQTASATSWIEERRSQGCRGSLERLCLRRVCHRSSSRASIIFCSPVYTRFFANTTTREGILLTPFMTSEALELTLESTSIMFPSFASSPRFRAPLVNSSRALFPRCRAWMASAADCSCFFIAAATAVFTRACTPRSCAWMRLAAVAAAASEPSGSTPARASLPGSRAWMRLAAVSRLCAGAASWTDGAAGPGGAASAWSAVAGTGTEGFQARLSRKRDWM